MKRIFVLLSLLWTAVLPAAGEYSFKVQEKQYMLLTEFEMSSDTVDAIGTVASRKLSVRTGYDVYDRTGDCVATATERFFCLGRFSSKYTEIDVYDHPSGKRVGVIDGQVGTTAAARLQIFNANGKKAAIAFLDDTSAGFSIVAPDNFRNIIARLKRHYVRDVVDEWEVHVYDPDVLDRRVIQVFAAFAVNHQNEFREDL